MSEVAQLQQLSEAHRELMAAHRFALERSDNLVRKLVD
jgi:hypothetical protein